VTYYPFAVVNSYRTPTVCIVVNVGFDGPLRNLAQRWDGALAR